MSLRTAALVTGKCVEYRFYAPGRPIRCEGQVKRPKGQGKNDLVAAGPQRLVVANVPVDVDDARRAALEAAGA